MSGAHHGTFSGDIREEMVVKPTISAGFAVDFTPRQAFSRPAKLVVLVAPFKSRNRDPFKLKQSHSGLQRRPSYTTDMLKHATSSPVFAALKFTFYHPKPEINAKQLTNGDNLTQSHNT